MAETRYTLQTLLTEYEVHIPQLQRDYAQGRKNKAEIRRIFVEQLRKTLDEEQHLNLDFIYGYIKNEIYYPLDGQQRLTTLWLLHWYLVPQEFCSESKKWLRRFGYRTRVTAERFCTLLVEHIEELRGSDVVKQIRLNSPWFRSSWEDEPTIAAMLEMLSEIEYQMTGLNRNALWERLISNVAQAAITFDSIDIHSTDFNLTDELYIKMNARGKALTPWECYKAQLIDILPKDEKIYDYEGRKLCSADYFAFRIEKEWLDCFWSSEFPNIEDTETRMRSFFHTIARLCFFRRPYTKQEGGPDDRPLDDFKEANKYKIFAESEHANLLIYALDLLDALHRGGGIGSFFEQISNGLSLFSSNNNLFDEVCREDPDVRSQVLFLFILEYMRKYNVVNSNEYLKDFVRVIRNQLERSRSLDKKLQYEPNIRINRINTYWSDWTKLIGDWNVYSFIANQPDNFLNKYEKQKAILVTTHPELKATLQRAEEHPYLRGLIGVLQVEDWENKLSKWTEALYEIWSTEDDCLIAQALIACGYRGAFIKKVDSEHREAWFIGQASRWGTILTFERDQDGKIKDSIRKLLNRYVERNEERVEEKLRALVDEFLSSCPKSERDWRYYFCKYPEMLKGSDRSSYFAWSLSDKNNHFDVRSLRSFSSNPMRAYHCNPYALAINSQVKNAKIRWSIGSDSVALEVADSLSLSPHEDGWLIKWAENAILNREDCQEVFEEFGITEESPILKDTLDRNRVEIAVDFCKKICTLMPRVKSIC